uniref:Uncharacterized protein n=1 Tax=Brassica oleracea var. oleracea TaxID=109376 RepID=A0A0D3B9U6_BRAOL
MGEALQQRHPDSQRLSQGNASVHSRLGDRVWVEKGSSQVSHTPPPRPPRETMHGSQKVNSSLERCPVTERISLPVARNILPDGAAINNQVELVSQDRVPALQRLTPPTNERIPLLLHGAANSESGRLQEVDVQYLEESFPIHILSGSGEPSSSRIPAKERLTVPHESPIRSLSGDRRHVAAGIMTNPPEVEEQPLLELQPRT